MNNTISQYDFSRVGKAMPYRAPQGFMERSESELRRRLHVLDRRALRRRTYMAAAAVMLLLAMAYPVARIVLHRQAEAASVAPVYSVTSAADNWTEFAEADIFLDSMDW